MSIMNVRRSTPSCEGRVGFALAVALNLLIAGHAAAVDVTACGQTVSASQTGVLQNDLDCPDSAQAVFVDDRATLEFGGHTITGGGILCTGRCIVRGPGVVQQVVGAGNISAVFAQSPEGRLTVEHLTITNNAFGILSDARKTTLLDVTVSNNLHHGVWAFGVVRGEQVTTNDNGGTGIKSENRTVRLTGYTATGNAQGGIINNGGGTRLRDSTLTGNAFGPFPDNPTMLDLFSERRPRLVNTTCDHSLGPDGTPWGVCSGD